MESYYRQLLWYCFAQELVFCTLFGTMNFSELRRYSYTPCSYLYLVFCASSRKVMMMIGFGHRLSSFSHVTALSSTAFSFSELFRRHPQLPAMLYTTYPKILPPTSQQHSYLGFFLPLHTMPLHCHVSSLLETRYHSFSSHPPSPSPL